MSSKQQTGGVQPAYQSDGACDTEATTDSEMGIATPAQGKLRLDYLVIVTEKNVLKWCA